MDEENKKREKRRRLRREIEELVREIRKEAAEFFMSHDLPPELAQQFLKEVLAGQSDAVALVRDLFEFEIDPPRPETLDDAALQRELDKLLAVLATKRIHIALNNSVPPRLIYKYILDEVLDAEVELIQEGRHVFNGCGGNCKICFQLPYCEIAKEQWPELFEE